MSERILKVAAVLVPLIGGTWFAARVWESRPYNSLPVRFLFSSGGFAMGAVMATLAVGLLASLLGVAVAPRRPR